MANSKVIYFGEVLIDLTGDTVTASDVANGKTFHDKTGATVTGTSTKDVDSSGATASVGEVLEGKTVAIRGSVQTGTMKNNGAVSGTISTKAGKYTVPEGYHDGSGSVGISATEQAKIIPSNIKKGITVLGVEGTLELGSFEVRQEKTVTPSKVQQIITPDDGYTCLTQVTVSAIPYSVSPNAAGGSTVTIG